MLLTLNQFKSSGARFPQEKYAKELQQIKDMGFNDEETILVMLEQVGGNVNLVLERLNVSIPQGR